MSIKRLRFKDENGINYPDWEHVKLNSVLDIKTVLNKKLKFNVEHMLSVSLDYGILNQIDHLGRSYAGKDIKRYKIIEKYDLIYTKSPLKNAPYGIFKTNFNEVGLVSPLYAVYKPITKELSILLDQYFSTTSLLNNYLKPKVNKGAKNTMNITDEAAIKGKILLPVKTKEQEKIGNFLSLFDRLIEKLETKIGLLKELKKGYLQLMFPSKGEPVPKIRFAKFDGEWEQNKLWALTTWDKKFNEVDRKKQENVIKYPYILANKLESLKDESGDVLLLSTGSVIGFTTEKKAGSYLCIGEIVSIPWGGKPTVKYWKGKFVTADNRIATSNNTEKLRNKYLYYFMNNRLKEIKAAYRGASIQHPSMNDILNMRILLPSKLEQEKIGIFFSSLDAIIEKQENELNFIEQLKKGYMQRLFA